MTRTIRLLACGGALVLMLAACSSSSGSKSSDTTKPKQTTTTTAAAAQTMTVTPSTGLTDGQMVSIVAKGYTPGATNIGITECADKGEQTGAGDCNLTGIKTAVPDASGTVTIDFAVAKGPFGASQIVCSATVKCLISVGEQVAAPKESATENIEFAG